jgi:hypothetical protein
VPGVHLEQLTDMALKKFNRRLETVVFGGTKVGVLRYDIPTKTLSLIVSGQHVRPDKPTGESDTGPNWAGTFTTQSSTNNSAPEYAGTFTSTIAGLLSGTFNLVINGTVITGLAITSDNQTTVNLAGTLSGTTITIRDTNSNTGIATGTLSGTTVSGSFDAGSNRGTWSGTLVQ